MGRGLLLRLCCLCVLGVAPMLAAQDAASEAKKFYKAGEEFQKQKKYKEAIAEFQKAYASSQQPVVLYAIAQCYRLQGSLEDALDFYREFLAAPKDASLASYETSAESFIKDLEAELVSKGKKSQKSTLEGRYLDDANRAFVEKRYADALPLYASVYQLSKRPFLLFYIARCHFFQKELAAAEDYYKRYLTALSSTQKPSQLDLKFQVEAEDGLAELFFLQSDVVPKMTVKASLPENILVSPSPTTSPQSSVWPRRILFGSLGASALTASLLLLRSAALGCSGLSCQGDQIVIEVP